MPAPDTTFRIGSARFAFFSESPAAGSAQEMLSQCRTWSSTSQLLWWDSLQELQSMASSFASTNAAPVPSLVATDLLCKGGLKYDGSDAACVRSSGAAVPQSQLRWMKVAPSQDESPYQFQALLYMQSGQALGLVGAPFGMLSGVVACRDGGGWRAPDACVQNYCPALPCPELRCAARWHL
jgi:hypothetical protein